MRPRRDLLVAGHSQVDDRLDHVLREDSVEEARVALEALDGLEQAARELLDPELPPLLWGELVDVLVDRVPRVELLLDAVEPGRDDCREREVGVGRGVGRPELRPLPLLLGGALVVDRDPDVRGAVGLAPGDVDRSLVSWDEPAVGIGRRVGDRRERAAVRE